MADNGSFFWDTREPFIGADLAAISPLTTDIPIYTPSNFPVLGGQYFARVGKKLKIRLAGVFTSAATPGNGTFDIYYGDGTAANGVLLASSAAHTLIASQSTKAWECFVTVRCITIGSTGTLKTNGSWEFDAALVAAQNGLIPATTSGACDLTAAKIISVQYKRSGSTAESMTCMDMEVVPVN